jgi:hypothetical protein
MLTAFLHWGGDGWAASPHLFWLGRSLRAARDRPDRRRDLIWLIARAVGATEPLRAGARRGCSPSGMAAAR